MMMLTSSLNILRRLLLSKYYKKISIFNNSFDTVWSSVDEDLRNLLSAKHSFAKLKLMNTEIKCVTSTNILKNP